MLPPPPLLKLDTYVTLSNGGFVGPKSLLDPPMLIVSLLWTPP